MTEADDLKVTTNAYIEQISNRLASIEANERNLKHWSTLRQSVIHNAQQTDESVLNDMHNYFGHSCLKRIIREVADTYIKEFQDKATAQSCDLRMIVKPKTI